jgi:hypothetical protein
LDGGEAAEKAFNGVGRWLVAVGPWENRRWHFARCRRADLVTPGGQPPLHGIRRLRIGLIDHIDVLRGVVLPGLFEVSAFFLALAFLSVPAILAAYA